jgi:hypothetical protein
MKKTLVAAVAIAALAAAAAAPAQTWKEPKSGTAFEVKRDGMTLLGAGLRVKKMIFTFNAYALGFYVDDAALTGPLAGLKPGSPELFQALQTGDFRRQVVLKFLRNLSQDKIQTAMRESLAGAEPKTLDQFIGYFPEVKEGQECVLRYAPGGTVESIMAGQAKPPITSKAFADQLFGLYVGPKPIQDDIKAGVVARFGELAGTTAPVARQASGTIKSVQPNGFTVTDSAGKDLVLSADPGMVIVARGASHKMDKLEAGGKAPTIAEFLAAKQQVLVKYVETGGKLTAREVQVR